MKVRRKIEHFEARQLSVKTRSEIVEWAGGNAWFYDSNGDSEVYVATADGGAPASDGDFIVKDASDNFLVYNPNDFAAKFEPIPA